MQGMGTDYQIEKCAVLTRSKRKSVAEKTNPFETLDGDETGSKQHGSLHQSSRIFAASLYPKATISPKHHVGAREENQRIEPGQRDRQARLIWRRPRNRSCADDQVCAYQRREKHQLGRHEYQHPKRSIRKRIAALGSALSWITCFYVTQPILSFFPKT